MNGRGVIDYDEGHYSPVALRMAESGDWVTPYAGHPLRTNGHLKPVPLVACIFENRGGPTAPPR